MSSQALNIATAGLRVTQASLAVVAGNVANAGTLGYVRKSPNQIPIALGEFGSSVRIAGINRELDVYLQRQLRIEGSGASYAGLRAQLYGRLQQVYGEPGSEGALETVFSRLTEAVQALTTSPESTATRSTVLSAAQVLAQQLNGMTVDVQGLRFEAELGLSDAVAQANEAMQQIAKLNQQLGASASMDATAAVLLDQRDNYINQLSQLMDIRVIAGDHNQVSVFTNSGVQLVANEASQLQFDASGTITPASVWSADPTKRSVGTITLVSPNGGTMDLLADNAIRSGNIAAYVEMRDRILPEAQNWTRSPRRWRARCPIARLTAPRPPSARNRALISMLQACCRATGSKSPIPTTPRPRSTKLPSCASMIRQRCRSRERRRRTPTTLSSVWTSPGAWHRW